jgi:hypothetical protein
MGGMVMSRYIIVGVDDMKVAVYGDAVGRSFSNENVAEELALKLSDEFAHLTFFVSPIDEYPLDYFEMEEDDEPLKMAW